jgi:hypothetical protein
VQNSQLGGGKLQHLTTAPSVVVIIRTAFSPNVDMGTYIHVSPQFRYQVIGLTRLGTAGWSVHYNLNFKTREYEFTFLSNMYQWI